MYVVEEWNDGVIEEENSEANRPLGGVYRPGLVYKYPQLSTAVAIKQDISRQGYLHRTQNKERSPRNLKQASGMLCMSI